MEHFSYNFLRSIAAYALSHTTKIYKLSCVVNLYNLLKMILLYIYKYAIAVYLVTDVNECLDNGGKGPCEDTCENHIGGYKCRCSIQGYKLSDDGHTCKGNYNITS